MNQDIIGLLEEAKQQGCSGHCVDRINQVLDILKQQPVAGEFTENLRKFVKLYENEVPRRAEITFLEEAYDIIDRAESTNKDLLDACEKSGKMLDICARVFLGTGDSPDPMELADVILKNDAAIAKAKKEGK